MMLGLAKPQLRGLGPRRGPARGAWRPGPSASPLPFARGPAGPMDVTTGSLSVVARARVSARGHGAPQRRACAPHDAARAGAHPPQRAPLPLQRSRPTPLLAAAAAAALLAPARSRAPPPPPPPPPPPARPPGPPPARAHRHPPPPRAHAPAAPQPQAKKVIAEPEPPPSQLQLPGWARDAPGGPLLATALAFAAGAYTLLAAASGARRARSLPDALQRLAVASAGSDGAAAALEQCELGLGRAAEVGRWGRGRRGCCWEAGFGGSAGMSDGCWCAMFEPPLPLALPYHFTPSTPFPPPSPAPPPQSPPPGGCQP
jgi:hypothetical protein